jgi:TP901 family phage tail tape measure protein
MAISNVELRVDARQALNSLQQVNRATGQLDGAINQLQRSFAGIAASFAGGFALSKIISDVKELDTNIRRLGTSGGDVSALDKNLSALSDRLGGVASKAELASASYQALSAGFSDTAGNIKLVEAATKAAVGGLADTTQVTEVLTKTLNAYGMSGEKAIKVTDSISKAIEYGQVEWSDYTSQLGRVASVAAIAGVSLDEVNAFVAAATKNGATAEIAFTGLGATLNTLLQPTKESQEAAKVLGIQWNLAGLQGKGFSGLMAELALKMGTNQEAAVRLLGSQEAMRGAFAAAAKGGKDYQMILEGLGGSAGKTDSDFNQMKTSIENQLKALDTAFKNLSEAFGVAFGPSVIKSVGDLTGLINGFAAAIKAVPQPVASAVVELVKIVAQMVLLQKAMQAIIALRVGFVAAMTASTTAVAASGTAAATTSSAYALYARNTQTLAAQSAAATAKVTPLGNALRSIASIGIITVGINLIVNGLSNAIRANQEIAKLRGQRAAGGAAAMYGGTAPAESKQVAQQTLKAIKAERKRGTPLATVMLGSLAGLVGQQTPADLLDRMNLLRERELTAQATLGLPTRAVAANAGGNGDGGGGNSGGDSGGSRAARAKKAKEIKDITAEELELQLRLGMAQQSQNKLQDAYYTKQLALLQLAQQEIGPNDRKAKTLDIVRQYATTLKEINEAEAKVTLPTIVERIADMAAGYGKALDFTVQLTEQQKQQKALADGIAGTVGEGMTSAFNALIQGSEDFGTSLRRIASGVLIDIANQLLQVFVIQKAINAISGLLGGNRGGFASGASFNPGAFGMASIVPGLSGVGNFFGGARANGGSVMGGKGYLVGERGPELFMPGRSGGIARTGSFGGAVSVVVNVDAGGTSVEGNEPNANQLGRIVGAAVQAEIVKQQRPGGLLANTR